MKKNLISILLIFATALPLRAQTDEIFAYLRKGSTVKIRVAVPHFDWVDIQDGEEAKSERLDWSNVKELRLTDYQVDEQVRKINELLTQLNEQDYSIRENAEQQLSNPDFSAAYKNLIRQHGETVEDDEVQYRVKRILDQISGEEEEFGARFDQLFLKDGTVRIGNVSGFSLVGLLNGKPVRMTRKDVQNLSAHEKSAVSVAPRALSVKTFNRLGLKSFYDEQQHIVTSFETDRFTNPLIVGKPVNELFAHKGILMGTEHPGQMIAVKYAFKFCPVDTGKICVCPFDEESGKRLRGVSIISFCLPDQPDASAGVHEFGIFLERVEHSRDVIVEAYNIHGQMLGMVEATDQVCVFAGFQSNEPITKIRISKNADLPELERSIDGTYALDVLTYSKPLAIFESTRVRDNGNVHAAKINFKDGQSLLVDQLSLGLNEISYVDSVAGMPPFASWRDIRSIAIPRLGAENISGNSRSLMVQLQSGSIVKVERENFLATYDFIGTPLAAKDVVGVWHRKARLAQTTDFEFGAPVIVYPSCRIIAKSFDLKDNAYSWDKSTSQKIVQNVQLYDEDSEIFTREEEKDPDLTPDVDQVDFSNTGYEIPTLWFKQPNIIDMNRPHVRLFDGQCFMLDNESGFKVTSIDPDKKSIEIAFGNETKTYPLTRIASLSLPNPVNGK